MAKVSQLMGTRLTHLLPHPPANRCKESSRTCKPNSPAIVANNQVIESKRGKTVKDVNFVSQEQVHRHNTATIFQVARAINKSVFRA